MDEQDLLEQYERTGNLMDLFQDETWVRKMVRIEEDANCDIGAGVEWGIYLGKVFANPTIAHNLIVIRSIMVRSLKNLLVEWNLGIAATTALERSKTLLMKRLQNPSPVIQIQLLSLLENPGKDEASYEIQTLVRSLLTKEDWEEIAQSASNGVHQYILEQALAPK